MSVCAAVGVMHETGPQIHQKYTTGDSVDSTALLYTYEISYSDSKPIDLH